MKFGIFTDSHYCTEEKIGTRRPNKSLEKFDVMLKDLKLHNVSHIICLGDIINTESNDSQNITNYLKFINYMTQVDMKMFLVLGNHDAEAFSNEVFQSLSNSVTLAPFTYETNDKLLIFLDANYTSEGIKYKTGKNDWTDSFLPIDILCDSLTKSGKEAVIFTHQNLDNRPNDPHIIKNAAQVRGILESSGKVKQVYQGHYHRGAYDLHNGIEYITLKAMCELDDIPYMIIDL